MDGLSDSMLLVSIQWLKIPMMDSVTQCFSINSMAQDTNGWTIFMPPRSLRF